MINLSKVVATNDEYADRAGFMASLSPMSASGVGALHVTYSGSPSTPPQVDLDLLPTESWTFGRSSRCDLVFHVDDLGVSRKAGSIINKGGLWMVENLSTKRALYIEEPGRPRQTIGPTSRAVIERDAAVVVVGDVFTYRLMIRVLDRSDEEMTRRSPTTSGLPETFVPRLSAAEQRVVAALAWQYLQDGARHDPEPLTYDEAAALLPGTTRDGVRKRMERLRERLAEVGVVGMGGVDNRRAIVEFCLASELIDAELLDAVAKLGR